MARGSKRKVGTKDAPGRVVRRDAGRPRGAPVEAEILTRAIEDIATHGLEGLSVERVAAAAEVNKTSVYRRWSSRDALIAAALERVLHDIELLAVDTGSTRGDLRALAVAIAALLQSDAGRALAKAAFASSSPELAALAQRRLAQQVSGPVEALVARAVARGDWRHGAKPERVFTLMVGGLMHRELLEGQAVDDAFLDDILNLLLAGVRPRESDPVPHE